MLLPTHLLLKNKVKQLNTVYNVIKQLNQNNIVSIDETSIVASHQSS